MLPPKVRLSMTTAVIRPGLLVSLKSTVTGGVTYERRDLEAPTEEQGQNVARWETTRRARPGLEGAQPGGHGDPLSVRAHRLRAPLPRDG